MDASELAALRTMYIFTPMEGETWGLTYQDLEAKLRERGPDEFVDLELGESIRGTKMYFGITLGDEKLEGIARLSPEGVAIDDCPAPTAAAFVNWLRENIVPDGMAMTFNTEWGLEEGLPDAPVPDVPRPRLIAIFLAHLEQTL
ncbi:hypothetical protein HUT19_22900 [Streptomyces sp. NA02950]|uniref:hypothetical protein n=1 Tax=Streptomyces sp. NA02950 TaxID=2742137 RepID=UPI0015914C4E|nr:hypothetical protein [Streptomyces sp. NA02950]QKV94253.1 hypothetical protein HUT19_22900 [Streptomyces sp. NA02950]